MKKSIVDSILHIVISSVSGMPMKRHYAKGNDYLGKPVDTFAVLPTGLPKLLERVYTLHLEREYPPQRREEE